jgi:hypothetical protein
MVFTRLQIVSIEAQAFRGDQGISIHRYPEATGGGGRGAVRTAGGGTEAKRAGMVLLAETQGMVF